MKECQEADIIIAAMGQPNFVKAEMVKEGAVIIDVGTTRVPDASRKSGFKLTGDVKFDEVAPKCSFITPVPGGVGPMTIVSLMKNTLLAGKKLFINKNKVMKTLLAVVAILYSVILSAQERITLLFVGDLMQHQAQIDAARTPQGTYDYSPCFSLVKEQIAQADIAIGNLEVTLGGRPYKGYPAFSAPDEYLKAIKDAGFDILLTANNHCLDRGKQGLERTLLMLDSLNIPHAGTYRDSADRRSSYPLIIEKKDSASPCLIIPTEQTAFRPRHPTSSTASTKPSCRTISGVQKHIVRTPSSPACTGARNINVFPTTSNAPSPTGCYSKE